MRALRWLIVTTAFALMAAVLHSAGPTPSPLRAQAAPAAAFSPLSGEATESRTVSFAGFGAAETLDFTFADPTMTPASVGSDMTFFAVTQDDGSGTFEFTPADWLTPLLAGTWTVTLTGEGSGLTATTTFTIQ